MELTRYQFDVLAFVEENGAKAYTHRDLSDSLRVSNTEITKDVEELTDRGLLFRRDGLLGISEAGLAALEPYRVQRAVIFAAGFGERMLPVTATTPKPMVKVFGVRIIDRLIDAMLAKDIRDITIVRGYLKERFDELLEKYPFLNMVDNDRYATENNIYSAILAGEKVDRCYICAGDLLLTNPAIIKKYHYCTNYLASYSEETDDWCFDFEKGYTGAYRKGGTYCYNQYEIAYWDAADSAKLREDFRRAYETEPDGKNLFWEFIPLVLYRDRYRVEIRPCQKSDIMEIDNFYELVQVDPSYTDYPGQNTEQA